MDNTSQNNDNWEITIDVKRYDLSDSKVLNIKLIITPDLSPNDVWEELSKLINLEMDNSIVLKLRLEDNTLVPLSDICQKENKKFIVEVTKVHQNLPAQKRSHLQAIYLDAVRSKISSMDKRLCKLESLIPEVRLRREIQCERTINALSTKIAFLERRIDELTPVEWKINSTPC